MARDVDLNITQINLRPAERRRFGWRNQPHMSLDGPHPSWALYLRKLTFRQIESERRGGLHFQHYHDSKAGFDVDMIPPHFKVIEKGTTMWFELEVIASRSWEGAISARVNILNGPRLLCRCSLSVVGDHRQLNG